MEEKTCKLRSQKNYDIYNARDICNISEHKKNIRKQMKNELKLFFENSEKNCILEKTQKAVSFFLQSEIYKNTKTLLFYVSSDYELQTRLILQKALDDQKIVAIPRVISQTQMDFFCLQNCLSLENQVEKGAFNIFEPKSFLQKLDKAQIDKKTTTALIPGLAFSKDGMRLGKGKGFYDRYFENLTEVLTCAFCFDFQILSDVPHLMHDVKVSYIASNLGICNCFDV